MSSLPYHLVLLLGRDLLSQHVGRLSRHQLSLAAVLDQALRGGTRCHACRPALGLPLPLLLGYARHIVHQAA